MSKQHYPGNAIVECRAYYLKHMTSYGIEGPVYFSQSLRLMQGYSHLKGDYEQTP